MTLEDMKRTLSPLTNGGASWTDVSPNMTRIVHEFIDNPMEVVAAFPDSSHAVLAVGVTRGTSGAGLYAKDIYVFSTTDGGKHWSTCRIRDNLPPNTYGQVPVQLNFINSSSGWMTTKVQDPGGEMVTRGALYQMTDGGKTWRQVNVSFGDHPGMPAANGMPQYGWVSFTSRTVGFTLGQGPTQTDLLSDTDVTLYRTEDGGKNWTKVSIRFPALPNPKMGRYTVIPPERVGDTIYLPVLVENRDGTRTTQSLHLYKSIDNGRYFAAVGHLVLNRADSTLQFGFWTTTRGWFWNNGELFETDDGGKTLRKVAEVPTGPSAKTAISWVDESVGMVSAGGDLWVTRDGGKTWHATAGR